jgi:hypothetical protein
MRKRRDRAAAPPQMAAMICEAMPGPATTRCSSLTIGIDAASFRAPSAKRDVAEEIPAEPRAAPSLGIALLLPTLARIRDLAAG